MKNKERTILCVLIATVFLMPLMGNTALASDVTYHFDSYDISATWEKTPALMVDGDENTFAGTENNSRVELCNGNTCDGTDLGEITKVEIRANASYNVSQPTLILTPIFTLGEGNGHEYEPPSHPNAQWSQWFDITADRNAPNPWTWTNISNLDCNVTVRNISAFELHCSKVEIRVTYTE